MSQEDPRSAAREAQLNDPAYANAENLKEDEKLQHAEHREALDRRHEETELHDLEKQAQKDIDHLAEELGID